MILKQLMVGQMAVFCYIVGCEQSLKCVLIDPAGSEEHIFRVLQQRRKSSRCRTKPWFAPATITATSRLQPSEGRKKRILI